MTDVPKLNRDMKQQQESENGDGVCMSSNLHRSLFCIFDPVQGGGRVMIGMGSGQMCSLAKSC